MEYDFSDKGLESLLEIVSQATPGVWKVWKNIHCDPVVIPAGELTWSTITDPNMPFEKVAGLSTSPDDYGRGNLNHVSTFNPDLVTALIHHIQKLKKCIAELKEN